MDFLDYFETNSTKLAETEAVKIPMQMMQLYHESAGIPQYIKALEKAQRRSVHRKLPVSDDVLAATAINALLSMGDYKDDTTSWLGTDVDQRTWAHFKTHFSAAYIAEEQRKNTQAEQRNPANHSVGPPHNKQPLLPQTTLEGVSSSTTPSLPKGPTPWMDFSTTLRRWSPQTARPCSKWLSPSPPSRR